MEYRYRYYCSRGRCKQRRQKFCCWDGFINVPEQSRHVEEKHESVCGWSGYWNSKKQSKWRFHHSVPIWQSSNNSKTMQTAPITFTPGGATCRCRRKEEIATEPPHTPSRHHLIRHNTTAKKRLQQQQQQQTWKKKIGYNDNSNYSNSDNKYEWKGEKGGKLDKSWKKFKMNQSTWRRSVRQRFYKLNSLGSKL